MPGPSRGAAAPGTATCVSVSSVLRQNRLFGNKISPQSPETKFFFADFGADDLPRSYPVHRCARRRTRAPFQIHHIPPYRRHLIAQSPPSSCPPWSTCSRARAECRERCTSSEFFDLNIATQTASSAGAARPPPPPEMAGRCRFTRVELHLRAADGVHLDDPVD